MNYRDGMDVTATLMQESYGQYWSLKQYLYKKFSKVLMARKSKLLQKCWMYTKNAPHFVKPLKAETVKLHMTM